MNVSTNCEKCQLYKSCVNPFLSPVIDWRAETKDTNICLVVADYTDGKDDEHNKYFASAARGYKLIQGQLADLECRYVFTTALACGVTNKDTKLTKENYNACFAEKLKPLILKYKPRAIVCLGKQAMDAVLQDKAPKTMKEIQKTGVSVDYYEEEDKLLNCLVLAVDHPARLFIEQTDKAKLASLYELIFSKAERYCLETEVRKPIDFTLISKKPDLYRIAGGKFKEFAFDVENKHNKKDLLKNTIWKRNSELLSLSITYFNETSGFYNNFVIVGEALEDKFLLEKLFSGRSVVTHNGKHDCQVLWNRLGFDVFSHVSEVHDTLAMFYLSNQNRLNNGLKDLSAKYLGIYDYADTVQRYVIEANSRLKILKKQASEELKLKQKQYNWYVEALKVQSGELTVSAQKAKKLKIILNSYPNLEAITELLLLAKQKYKEVPEPGTADYGDIPIDILAQYNAEDTYCTLKLKREIIPFLEKTEGYTYDPVAYKLFQRSLKTVCYVERNGMPLDMTSLLEMKAELEAKEKEIQTKLLSLDVVKEVLLKVDSNQEKLEKGKLTEADLPKLISPTKAKFITSLCKNFKLDNFATLTKKNKKSFVSKKCINSIRDSFKDVNQEIFEIFSDLSYIGNNRQVRSKFIKNWSTYYVPEDGKLHCSYNLTKNQSLAYNTGSSDAGAQSGRLSATQPNLQQIRKVGYLRKHFRAPPGYVFCEIDYSSLEPCLISSVSNCERLKEVFKKKLDIYRVTANDIYEFGVDLNAPPEQVREALKTRVNETDRDKLKVGFLAWCYGRGIPSFARDMKITEEEAVEFYRKAKEMYYEIYDWKEGIIDTVKNQEMVHTLFGRKREFPVMPPLNRSDEERKRYRKELSKAIRVAVNFPIQSLGSDICLWQASNIQDWIIDENLEQVIVIVNLVHDAIWFLIKESQIDWAVPELQKRMEDITTLPNGIDVPLNTEALWGPTLASYLKKNTQLELSYP